MSKIRTNLWLVIGGGIAAAAVAVTIIILAQGADLQKPADIVQEEPSRQTAISIVETVTITIPEGAASGGIGGGSNQKHYVPELATVSSESQVTWINADTIGHTATAGTPTDGPSGQFDTGTISPGESKSVMIQAEGGQSLMYYCIIHPWLTGELQMTL